MAALIFLARSILFILIWNRFYERGNHRVFIFFVGLVFVYQAETLLTTRVDIPANLLYHAFPWQSVSVEPVAANTGIVITELVPWTIEARRAIFLGEWPLWDRNFGSGSPLASNQQTAIFHPFTLLGLALPVGKAWTLSASFRLLFALFFTYRFLVGWSAGKPAAVFGAITFTFSTFGVIWLLFPVGLANVALPIVLSGIDDLVREIRARTFLLASVGLMFSILGGHPESTAWVAIVGAAYAVCAAVAHLGRTSLAIRAVSMSGLAMLCAIGITAFWWYPTWALLPETDRFHLQQSISANPVDHQIGAGWLTPLLVPNIHGTPQQSSFIAPAAAPITLTDYGEVASGYAGAVTLAFCVYALLYVRNKPILFFAGLMIFVFFTIYEVPGWRVLVRWIPIAGDVLLQRLRVFWVFGVACLAAFGLDHALERDQRPALPFATIAILVGSTYFFSAKLWLARGLALEMAGYFAVSLSAFALVWVAYHRGWKFLSPIAMIATLAELWLLTANYNPSARPQDLFPVTPALSVLQSAPKPARVLALGWSLLPDTPGAYGIEDIKSTDPIQHARSRRLHNEFLKLQGYDQIVGDLNSPFLDYLNVVHIYAPPGHEVQQESFQRVYTGRDGSVYRNTEALPRYFFPPVVHIESSSEEGLARLRRVRSYSGAAVVDHIPAWVQRREPGLIESEPLFFKGGDVSLLAYTPTTTELKIRSDGWNLLVSSDAAWDGWRAYWNGERVPPVVVNGGFLGAFVPAGEGILRFRYFPDSFETGLEVSGASAIVVALALVVVSIRRRRGHLTSTTGPVGPIHA